MAIINKINEMDKTSRKNERRYERRIKTSVMLV